VSLRKKINTEEAAKIRIAITQTIDRGNPKIRGVAEEKRGYIGQIRQIWRMAKIVQRISARFFLCGDLAENTSLVGMLSLIELF
jgi:hypothetical protein